MYFIFFTFFTRCPFLLIFMELHIPLVRFFLHLIWEKHFQINNTLLNIHTSVPSRVSLIRLKRFRLRTSKPSAIYPVKWFRKTPCSFGHTHGRLESKFQFIFEVYIAAITLWTQPLNYIHLLASFLESCHWLKNWASSVTK